MTWEDLGKRTAALTKAAQRSGYFGMEDAGGSDPGLEVWLRERGKQMYLPDGKFGADVSDMSDWFGFWQDMRAQGGCVTPDMQALDKSDIDTEHGDARQGRGRLRQFQPTGRLSRRSTRASSTLPCTRPGAGHQVRPVPEALADVERLRHHEISRGHRRKLLSFFVANWMRARCWAWSAAFPRRKRCAKPIAPTLDDMAKRMSDYIAFITDKVGTCRRRRRAAPARCWRCCVRTNEQVGFKRVSPPTVPNSSCVTARDILSRGYDTARPCCRQSQHPPLARPGGGAPHTPATLS